MRNRLAQNYEKSNEWLKAHYIEVGGIGGRGRTNVKNARASNLLDKKHDEELEFPAFLAQNAPVRQSCFINYGLLVSPIVVPVLEYP